MEGGTFDEVKWTLNLVKVRIFGNLCIPSIDLPFMPDVPTVQRFGLRRICIDEYHFGDQKFTSHTPISCSLRSLAYCIPANDVSDSQLFLSFECTAGSFR